MTEQMKGITCCGDCAYYSMKKHRCTRGCIDESDARASFFADCPLSDVRPVVQGQWEFERESLDEQIEYCCSICGWIGVDASKYNFCPNCGAAMRGKDNGCIKLDDAQDILEQALSDDWKDVRMVLCCNCEHHNICWKSNSADMRGGGEAGWMTTSSVKQYGGS